MKGSRWSPVSERVSAQQQRDCWPSAARGSPHRRDGRTITWQRMSGPSEGGTAISAASDVRRPTGIAESQVSLNLTWLTIRGSRYSQGVDLLFFGLGCWDLRSKVGGRGCPGGQCGHREDRLGRDRGVDRVVFATWIGCGRAPWLGACWSVGGRADGRGGKRLVANQAVPLGES